MHLELESTILLILRKSRSFSIFVPNIFMRNFDLVIVGAGAAGLLAACRASELGQKVAVVEKVSIPGKKLLITGKGRCNITNDSDIRDFIEQVHPDGRFLYSAFKQFYSYDILGILGEEGVDAKLERGGRYFPESDKASDVVDALYHRALKNRTEFFFDSVVEKVHYKNNRVSGLEYIKNDRKEIINSDKVIICTGGKSYPGTGSTGDGYKLAIEAGHSVNKVFPALVPLVSEDKRAREMQGLSLKNVQATLIIDSEVYSNEFGEMLFTHYGLSGPIILTLSRDIVLALDDKKKVEIDIDWKPALDYSKLDKRLLRDINDFGKTKVSNIFRKWLPQKAVDVFISSLGINPDKLANQISSEERITIIEHLKSMKFRIHGHRGYREAIITAGGVDLKEINPKTMESKIKKGLFFAGEVLDLDAITGGYNLQIAFSTGWVAGA